MPADLAGALLARCGELWNLYGPTETTIYSTGRRITHADQIDLGRPIANTTVMILDGHRQLVPVGVVGEVYIGGVGLARGYHDRPDLTADRFGPHPVLAGERVYRTGDLARWRPDGHLELPGPHWIIEIKDPAVFRVELGEIEATLRAHPGVTDAVALLREDVPGARRLVAYVTGDASPADLRAWVARRLPDYAVPALLVPIETMPLSPSGKVDRRALPAPSHDRPDLEAPFVAPRTATEARLAAIWQEVLGVARVGVGDEFFLLGGHSLLALSVMHRIRGEFDVAMAPNAIFREPTHEGLAAPD